MMKLIIIKMITMYSIQYGIDPKVALSVCQIESNFNTNVIGITGDIGLFQLNPNSFPNYSKNQLKDPITNMKLGIKYLAKMKKECNYKNNNEWLVCYNYGMKNAKKIKHPELFPYVKRINLVMNDRNF
jgi:soluble lytic murein transglycosylase